MVLRSSSLVASWWLFKTETVVPLQKLTQRAWAARCLCVFSSMMGGGLIRMMMLLTVFLNLLIPVVLVLQ